MLYMKKWINIHSNWDITFSYEWEEITLQWNDLEWFYKFWEWTAPEWYHIPTKEERNRLIKMRMMANWYYAWSLDTDSIAAIQDWKVTESFMKEFNLKFNWWSEDSESAVDDWDDHWRYWTSTEAGYEWHWYALRLCWTYAFLNDFDKTHWYSVRCFKD